MNFDNATLMVEEFDGNHQRCLAGLHSVIPYRIGPVMRQALAQHRQTAHTTKTDLTALAQEIGALDIKFIAPGGFLAELARPDYDTQRVAVRLPASRDAHTRALETDTGLSDDPRFKNYIAGGFSFDDTDSDDAWWFLYKDDDVIAHPDGKAAYDRAVRIFYADEWQENFFRDYRIALCEKMKKAFGQNQKHADEWYTVSHMLMICRHFSETPRYRVYPELDMVLVPRYAPFGKACHLQPEDTEEISHAEAFAQLNAAGLHLDIAPTGKFETESRTEKTIIDVEPKDWPVPWQLPRYQYVELSPELVQDRHAAKAAGTSYDHFNKLVNKIFQSHNTANMYDRKGYQSYLTSDAAIIVFPSPIYRNSRDRNDLRLVRYGLYPEGMRALTYSEAAEKLAAMGDMPRFAPYLQAGRPTPDSPAPPAQTL